MVGFSPGEFGVQLTFRALALRQNRLIEMACLSPVRIGE